VGAGLLRSERAEEAEQEPEVPAELREVPEEQPEREEVGAERERSWPLAVSVSVLVAAAVVVVDDDKLRYTVRSEVSEVRLRLRYRYTDRRATRTVRQNWFCGDRADRRRGIVVTMEAVGRTCWVTSGAVGGRVDLPLTSRRTFCRRGVSYRTGHSPSSGDTDRTDSPLPAGVVPCKYRIVVAAESRYVVADVDEAAGTRSVQEDLRLHDCSEAREQVG